MTRVSAEELLEISKRYKQWLAFQRLNRECEKQLGISITQWHLLRWVYEFPGITPGQLAEKTELHKSSITPLVKRLLRKGFLAIETDAWDRRRHFLAITRSGKLIVDKAGKLVKEYVKKDTVKDSPRHTGGSHLAST